MNKFLDEGLLRVRSQRKKTLVKSIVRRSNKKLTTLGGLSFSHTGWHGSNDNDMWSKRRDHHDFH